MSIVIIGGNECMVCQYKKLCKNYGYCCKVFAKERGSFKKKLGTPDLMVLFKLIYKNWLSSYNFSNAVKALCFKAFRHFALREMFLNLLKSPHVFLFKGSKQSSKTAIYYLGNQPFHFGYCAVRGRMGVIVQRHCDIGMSHDVLQCFRVHSGVC